MLKRHGFIETQLCLFQLFFPLEKLKELLYINKKLQICTTCINYILVQNSHKYDWIFQFTRRLHIF